MIINIRLAVPTDALDIAEIHMRSWEAAYKDIVPMDYIQKQNSLRPALWQRIFTDENTSKYVIQIDGKTVGFMDIASPRDDDASDDIYELHGLYLYPDYYRQGIGSQAMDFAFKKAFELGKKAMNLWVFADNISSIKFYEKCGFAADGKTQTLNCGKQLTAIRMIKSF